VFALCLQVFLLGSGWQTVAALLLAATFHLPRLPKHPLWPFCDVYNAAVIVAACLLAPIWPSWWLRWLACFGLVLFWHSGFLRLYAIFATNARGGHSSTCLWA
jgi:hypothetical protein